MDFFTQEDLSEDFDYLLDKVKIRIDFASPKEVIGILLQLTLGLSEHEFRFLTWGDFYYLNSDYKIAIHDKLKIRGFDIFIPKSLHAIIYNYYEKASFPPIYQVFRVDVPKRDLRIQYGRKVLETYGYSDEVVKDLKVQFKMRQNSQLFEFLGYKKKAEINYSITHLNLDIKAEPIAKLRDKNFFEDYHFQTFTSFSNFLREHKVDYSERLQSNIRIILLLSLYNGVRLSKFLTLNWADFLIFNSLDFSVSVRNTISFSGTQVIVPSFLKKMILYNFEAMLSKKYFWVSWENPYMKPLNGFDDRIQINDNNDFFFILKAFPEMDFISPVFTIDNGNRITQPSLSREMKKGLSSMGFLHSNSIKTTSTLIMWGRRILELRGDHKATIQTLKRHFGFNSEVELAKYLHVYDSSTNRIEYEGQKFKNRFEAILYGIEFK